MNWRKTLGNVDKTANKWITILTILDRYEMSFRTQDGDWFEGISKTDYDNVIRDIIAHLEPR
jgi:hypothetical protein